MAQDDDDQPPVSEGVMVAIGGDGGTIKRLGRHVVKQASEILWVRIAKRFVFLGILLAVLGSAGMAITLFGGGIRQYFMEAGFEAVGTAFQLVAAVLVVGIVVLGFLQHFDEATHPVGDDASTLVAAGLPFVFGVMLTSSVAWAFIQAEMDLLLIAATGTFLSGATIAGVALIGLGAHEFWTALNTRIQVVFEPEADDD